MTMLTTLRAAAAVALFAFAPTADAQLTMMGVGPGGKAAGGGALSCSYTPVTTGTQSVAYTGATPSASGGTPSYTFSETGTLPGGLSISSSTGVISGTPSASGSFPTIQVKVTDSTSTVANCGSAFTLVISPSGGGTITQDTNTTLVQPNAAGTATVTFSTTAANDIIVCAVHSLDNTLPVVTGFAGASLTWTRVGTALTSPSLDIGNGPARQSLDIFWALAPTAITSQILTATYSPSYNAATMNCTSWKGVNTTTPFDANASLPKTAANGTTTPTVSQATGITTNGSATAFIAFVGSQDANTPVAGTGYTLDFGGVNGNSFSNELFGAEHKINTITQTGVTVPFSSGVTNADWIMEVVAITP